MKVKENITSKVIKLVQPGKFKTTLINKVCRSNEVVVEPTILSICQADIRYFFGMRDEKALHKKLPMALFHEGIGRVINSKSSLVSVGARVVVVPNIPGYKLNQIKKADCCRTCRLNHTENYCDNGVFLGSGYDGLSQSKIVVPYSNVVEIPENIPDKIAVLTELVSVSLQAISQANTLINGRIAIFGDGPVGYITASLLHHAFNISKKNLIVFGAQEDRLRYFDFATTYLVQRLDFNKDYNIQTVFECTGGKFSKTSINQAIELINNLGEIILMGVSEQNVPLNTRKVLAKGLRLKGTSRSETRDFIDALDYMRDKKLQKILSTVTPDSPIIVKTNKQLCEVIENVKNKNNWRKTNISIKFNSFNIQN